jgi:hypothetical protein
MEEGLGALGRRGGRPFTRRFLVAVALFMASRLIEPVLAQLVEGLPQLPQFMGVPVPGVLLGAIVAGLALRGRLHLSSLLRFAPPPP